MSLFRRARMNQIRSCSRLIKRLSRLPPLFAILRRVREFPAVRPVLSAVAGYRRPFATFADAAAAIAGYEGGGHTDPRYIALTVRDAAISSLDSAVSRFSMFGLAGYPIRRRQSPLAAAAKP